MSGIEETKVSELIKIINESITNCFYDSEFKNDQKVKEFIDNIKSIIGEKINENLSKSDEDLLESNYFIGIEIENEYKDILAGLQKITYESIPEEEEIENEYLAHLLKGIGEMARRAEKDSKIIFDELYREFKNYTKDKIILKITENKIFSSWVKYHDDKINSYLLNQKFEINFEDEKIKDKLNKYYFMLVKLYVHCLLSIPYIELKYTREHENFDGNLMKDIYNRPKKESKVNFTYLPGLFSNGKFLENGKNYVLTYTDKTFYFKELLFDKEDQK